MTPLRNDIVVENCACPPASDAADYAIRFDAPMSRRYRWLLRLLGIAIAAGGAAFVHEPMLAFVAVFVGGSICGYAESVR